MQATRLMRSVHVRQTLFLIAITVVYLCFELGFNARLLDVVGGAPAPEDVEGLEVYGRSLSGIAAALVVLQVKLRSRAKTGGRGPSLPMIALWCALTLGTVYVAIKVVVDVLVATRTAEFRRTAFNSLLLQDALAHGQVALDGLVDDQGVFAQPEGKAFMALFPFLALSSTRLDERLSPLKDALIGNGVRRKVTPQRYYEDYVDRMKEAGERWKKYARIPVANDEDLLHEQDKAWNDYLKSLSRHGWTPQSVPASRRGAVVNKVRKQVPVPSSWDPADEVGFRDAVEQRYRRTVRGVQVGKDWIPPGLSHEQFVLRPGVQAELRKALGLPAGTTVAPVYRSPAEFRKLYDAMVQQQVRALRAQYDAPAAQFEHGGDWFAKGREAARAVIVPPVALFFSLLGAVGHLAKLLYLLATLVLLARRRDQGDADEGLSAGAAWLAFGVLLGAVVLAWGGLTVSDNRITRSELFQQLVDQVRAPEPDDGNWDKLRKAFVANVTHVVAVGQGYGYPINESIRIGILQGLSYGYHPTQP
ncbi:hypothetical protein [uncultured Massilia sp.]|uniref:hypothetical protein n=1 Tax=uncultured Massilia sp. TaxID=169973 RepID=UPI0025EEE6FA|nr:hypothetical protein [uncultured Massilia sp.]